MLLTSQNRIAVFQANSTNLGGKALAAAVVHQHPSTMRPYLGMRRTRLPVGLSESFRMSKPLPTDADRLTPDSCRSKRMLRPQLWARLVLSKIARG